MNDPKMQRQMFRTLNPKNPLIVARFVFLAVLAYLTVLQLIFAAWNIGVTTSAGLKVSNAPVFLIFNTCIISLCLIHVVMDMAMPREQFSSVRIECIWPAATSLLQTGIAIGITISAPQEFCRTSNWASCASSSLLVPIAWLISAILLSYFFALTIVAVAHSNVCSSIWRSTIHDIAWFDYPPVNQKEVGDCDDYGSDWKDGLDPKTEGKAKKDAEKAPWAAFAKVRRGIDHPFAIDKKLAGKVNVISLPSIPAPPYTPFKVQERAAGSGSIFIEIMNEPVREVRQAIGPGRFPSTVADHNRPIPLPSRTEWVRADHIRSSKRII